MIDKKEVQDRCEECRSKDARIDALTEQVRDGVTYGMLMKSREMVADLKSENAKLEAEKSSS